MGIVEERAQDESTRTGSCLQVQPSCPVCGGVLLPLRGTCRCTRCAFSLCVGCDGTDLSDLSDRLE
jgi:hypothetical protein